VNSEKIKVVLSLPNQEAEMFVDLINDMKEKLNSDAFDFNYEASDDSTGIQISKIQSLLIGEPNYLIIYPVSIYGLETVINQAERSGTKVIIIGGEVNLKKESDILAIVKPDYALEGALCAQELYKSTGNTSKKFRVLELQGKLASTQTRDRAKGFRDELMNYDYMEFIDVSENNENRNDGYIHTKEMIDKYGKSIDGVFAHDDEIGLGAIDAFLEAEYDLSQLPIISIGGDEDIKDAISANQYYSSIESTLNYGENVVQIIRNHVEGNVVSDIILPSNVLITDRKE
jgi:ABC-type sugar transport system substrate-binding protein